MKEGPQVVCSEDEVSAGRGELMHRPTLIAPETVPLNVPTSSNWIIIKLNDVNQQRKRDILWPRLDKYGIPERRQENQRRTVGTEVFAIYKPGSLPRH